MACRGKSHAVASPSALPAGRSGGTGKARPVPDRRSNGPLAAAAHLERGPVVSVGGGYGSDRMPEAAKEVDAPRRPLRARRLPKKGYCRQPEPTKAPGPQERYDARHRLPADP